MHDLPAAYVQVVPQFLLALLPLIIGLLLWSIVIKGFALWHSARGNQMAWFIVLLFIHTLGILEVVYLLFFRHAAPEVPVNPLPADRD
ncbi:MAG: DUF5652 family protein [Candidatus Paceibacteria bacterium]